MVKIRSCDSGRDTSGASKPSYRKGRRRSNHVQLNDEESATQKLYAMAVDRFFSGYGDKDERFRVLTKEEERDLIERLKGDREELEKELVTHNIFLAINFASKQQYRFSDFDELLSLSMYALMDAARKFDISKGCRFNTYAVWYLKKHVLRKFYVKKENEIERRTSMFLDDSGGRLGEDGDADFMYSTLNSQIEPSMEEAYGGFGAVSRIEDEEHETYMRDMLNKVIETVSTSSLSDTDKLIFRMSFLEGGNIQTISHELGISSKEVSNGRKRILCFINENFSKEEIFSE